MTALRARTDFKEEGGKFWMSYEDFLYQFNVFVCALGQESRTGGTEKAEYRPMIDMPS